MNASRGTKGGEAQEKPVRDPEEDCRGQEAEEREAGRERKRERASHAKEVGPDAIRKMKYLQRTQ